MPRILIADASKSSLVMTSEVFKDKLPGAAIDVAVSGNQCLDMLPLNVYDMIVVDFDLPDADGVTLTKVVRKQFNGPILLTAFPEEIVDLAINKELFVYHDSCMWIAKPVKFDTLAEKIDLFLINKKRLCKRFQTDIATLMVGKGAGRGKRAPKVKGSIVNMGIGGALITLNESLRMKIGDEVMITFDMPVIGQKTEFDEIDLSKIQNGPSKIKAKIAWTNKKRNQAGIQFDNLTDQHRKSLEIILRKSEEIALD